MTAEELTVLVAHLVDGDSVPLDRLTEDIVRITGYPKCEVLTSIYAMYLVGLTQVFVKGNEMNPFKALERQLQSARSGDVAAEALSMLAPLWAADHQPDGRLPVTVVMDKLNTYPNGRLVRQMKSLVQSLKGLN